MTTTDPAPTRPAATGHWSRLRAPAVTALAGLGGAALVHVRDPNVAGSWGPAGVGLCPFHAITGLWCPGCGGLRAVHALTDGDLATALGANVVVVGLVVVLAVAWVRWVRQRWTATPGTAASRSRMLVLPARADTAVLVGLAVFTVVRNLPFGAFLAP